MHYSIPTNCLSSIISCLLTRSRFTLWVRSFDYQRQLYVANEFFDIVGIERNTFYKKPQVFNDLVIAEDLPSLQQDIEQQVKEPLKVQVNNTIFGMRTKDGVRPWGTVRFPILNQYQQIIGLAGLGYEVLSGDVKPNGLGNTASLPEQLQWFENQLNDILDNESKQLSSMENALKQIDVKKTHLINGEEFALSRRELQCLLETLKGHSAKITGEKLFLAQRTVEEYLDNIRKKAKCRNKIELIAKFASQLKCNLINT